MSDYLMMVTSDNGMVVGIEPDLTLKWGEGMSIADVERIAESNQQVASWLPAIKKLHSVEMIATRPVTHLKTGNDYRMLEVDVINATNTAITDGTRMVLYASDDGHFVRESNEFGDKFQELEELDQ